MQPSAINCPARITKTSATLVDNIFTNFIDNVVAPAVFTRDLSDHFPVLARIGSPALKLADRQANMQMRINQSNELLTACRVLIGQQYAEILRIKIPTQHVI